LNAPGLDGAQLAMTNLSAWSLYDQSPLRAAMLNDR
jgi:hypothetical protein